MRSRSGKKVGAAALASGITATLFWIFNARGASPESEVRSVDGNAPREDRRFATVETGPVATPENSYYMPDLPEWLLRNGQTSNRWFTFRAGASILLDYTAFLQDAASLSQVGEQRNLWDARELRFRFRGTIGNEYQINYYFAGEYNGIDADRGKRWTFADAWFRFPIGPSGTLLTVGKTKETFAYELVSSFYDLPFQERILKPFFVSRNIGGKISQVFANQRMTASAGVFNDWWATSDSFKESGTDVSTRLTGLLCDQLEAQRFVHLGVSGRYVGADDNTLRYAEPPGVHVAANYVDTGDIPADHAWHLGFEGLWSEGPFSLLGEYNRAWVRSASADNPEFFGYYITASWVLTGEARPYDHTNGYARRITPKYRGGAPELVARFSHIDLDDKAVQGGKFDKIYVGINWWATQQWRLAFGWGHIWLDRFDKTGVTDSFVTRFQWTY